MPGTVIAFLRAAQMVSVGATEHWGWGVTSVAGG